MKYILLSGLVVTCLFVNNVYAIDKVNLTMSKPIKKEVVVGEMVGFELFMNKNQPPVELSFISEKDASYSDTAELALTSYLSSIWPSKAMINPERSIRAFEVMRGVEYKSISEREKAVEKLQNKLLGLYKDSNMKYPTYYITYVCKCDGKTAFLVSRGIEYKGENRVATTTYWLEKKGDTWRMAKENAQINGLLHGYLNGTYSEATSSEDGETIVMGDTPGVLSMPIESVDGRVLELMVEKGVVVK